MNRRIMIYAVVGLALAAGMFYWIYVRPLRTPAVKVRALNDPAVKKSVSENRDQVLVIGVDGMTWEIALDLVSQGEMPNLARLIASGSHGAFRAAPPLISPAIWTTIATGQPASVHGIDNFFAKVPFEYRESIVSSRHRRVPALWQMADWAGRSVGVVNWYAARPAEQLMNGVFVAEGIESLAEVRDDAVSPEAWLEKVRTAPLPKLLFYEELLLRVRDARVQKAYDLDRMVFSVSLEIMRERRPDLMMVYFQNVDVLSHGFWKYSWPLGLDYAYPVTREQRERYRGVVENHYRFTDRLIGGLLAEAEGYTVMVVSDHGLGPTYPPRNIFPDLNKLLERLGYLKFEGATCEEVIGYLVDLGELKTPEYRSAGIFSACQRLTEETNKWLAQGHKQMDPPAVDAFLTVHFDLKMPVGDAAIDERQSVMTDLARALAPGNSREEMSWAKTRLWNGEDFHKSEQGLFINLRERELEGAVARGDYQKFRKKVIRDLRALRTDGGRRLFTSVKANPNKPVMPTTVADPPDLLVEINRDALTDEYAFRGPSDRDPIPLAAIRWSYRDVSADHVPEGMFVVAGKNASAFKRVDATDLDLAPTLLWLLGLPLGADLPGRPLVEAFDEPLQKRAPLYIKSWSEILPGGAGSAPVEMSPGMTDRFKAIGYIQD